MYRDYKYYLIINYVGKHLMFNTLYTMKIFTIEIVQFVQCTNI